ncbi:hypothetical protein [Tsuneonella rigui]|uniref:hypothetical protein n=1 Tax=Tsuneonella rigui TaxID=1708790 RepID=UPI000F7EFB81|nr:hypothetical protein [Tsuneonella rigui]
MRLSFLKIKDFVLAAACEVLYFESQYEEFYAGQVQKRLEGVCSEGLVRRALRALSEDGLVTISQFDESSDTAYSLTDQGLKEAEKFPSLAMMLNEPLTDLVEVPASDRIVTRSDNLPEVQAIEEALDALSNEIVQSNEVGESLGDEREVIREDIAFARDAVHRERFRLSSLLGWLKPILKFLSERFAGKSIDEIVIRLAQALDKLS